MMSGRAKHGSIITVEFGKDEYYPTIKQRQFTGINFLSYIGGTLGLFAGFSFLTVFELLIYFGLRSCLGSITKKNNQKKVWPIKMNLKLKKLSKVPRFVQVPLMFGQSYVENSSIHGINHASQKNLSAIERYVAENSQQRSIIDKNSLKYIKRMKPQIRFSTYFYRLLFPSQRFFFRKRFFKDLG